MKFARNPNFLQLNEESSRGCGTVLVVPCDGDKERRETFANVKLVGKGRRRFHISFVVHQVRRIDRNREIRTRAQFVRFIDRIVRLNIVIKRGGNRQTPASGKAKNANLRRIDPPLFRVSAR